MRRLLGGLCAVALPAMGADLAVTNYESAETLRYPLVLLRGTLPDATLDRVTVVNASSTRSTREMVGNAHRGRFKALAELVPGKNTLRIAAGEATATFVLHYQPQTNPYKVRAVHFTDRTGDPTYQTPFTDEPQDYRAKWDASLKLLQTFTADEMHRLGHGRRTFNLELDDDGNVMVHVVKGRGSFEELQQMSGGAAYGASTQAIAEQLPKGPFKDVVNVAFSRHVKETGRATAYAALGGGDTALMGGACFYTWPTGVARIHDTFMSVAQIDERLFHADDIGRYAVWATAATTIGSGLHELGHALTLPHTRNYGNGIMRRGADTLNRYLGFVDPPCRWHKESREFKDGEEPCWSDVCAAALAPSRWLALDARDYTDENTIRFELDVRTSELVVRSDNGLAFACVEVPGEAERFDGRANLRDLPKELRLPLSDIARDYQTSRLTIRAMDGMGHYRHTSLKGLLSMETNLTTGKPATASMESASEHSANAAVDGDLGTYWDASPYPQWLQVDLKRAANIDEIRLYAYADGGRSYQYTIEGSLDGKAWSRLVDAGTAREVSTDQGYRHVLPPTALRHLRVTMLKNSANPGVHVRELRVFEPGAPRTVTPYVTLKSLFEAGAPTK